LWSDANIHALHGDAVFDRADEPAEIAADTFVFIYFRDTDRWSDVRAVACMLFHVRSGNAHAARGDEFLGILETFDVDTLVRPIPAGDVTEVAADAFIRMDAGDDLVIQVEMLPFGDVGRLRPRKSSMVRKPFSSIQLLRPSIMSSTMRKP